MKTLVEHMIEQDDLQERLLRTGAIATYGARARREGEESVRSFKQGQQTLRKGGPDVNLEDRVKRIEQSLDYLLSGLIAQRHQIGAGVAVDVVGHGLATKRNNRS
ncbi:MULTISPECIES: hypothetical protein [unclassified Aliiroseovarius]|uniref:hypothetical protein n=1 Tax=unclassified Aliiroseovarius TaxID=2623558 RepID=UPI0015697015|nr:MULTISPECIES: hypothetical protein [unclassified Aliiroseovarius]